MNKKTAELWQEFLAHELNSMGVIKPKELDDGKAQNMAEDDFGVPKGGPYAGVPYWNELTAGEKDEPNGNKKQDFENEVDEEWISDYEQRRGSCQCGAEKVYGANATHSDWCPKGGDSAI